MHFKKQKSHKRSKAKKSIGELIINQKWLEKGRGTQNILKRRFEKVGSIQDQPKKKFEIERGA